MTQLPGGPRQLSAIVEDGTFTECDLYGSIQSSSTNVSQATVRMHLTVPPPAPDSHTYSSVRSRPPPPLTHDYEMSWAPHSLRSTRHRHTRKPIPRFGSGTHLEPPVPPALQRTHSEAGSVLSFRSGQSAGRFSYTDNHHAKVHNVTYGNFVQYQSISALPIFVDDTSWPVMCTRRLLAGCTFVFYLLLFVVTGLFATVGSQAGIFEHSFHSSHEFYSSSVQPPLVSYSIYGFLYTWNLIWILWSQSVLCQSEAQGCFRISPPVLTTAFYLFFLQALLALFLWIFVLDQRYSHCCLWLLALAFLNLLGAFIVLNSNFHSKLKLLTSGFRREFWILKLFAQNGISSLLVVVYVDLVVFGHFTAVNEFNLPPAVSENLTFGVLALSLMVYLSLDLVVFERCLQLVIGPYLSSAWLASWHLYRTYQTEEPRDKRLVVSSVFIVASAVLAVARLLYSFRRSSEEEERRRRQEEHYCDPADVTRYMSSNLG